MHIPGARQLTTLLVILPLAACAVVRATVRSYQTAPGGLELGQQELRDALVAGRFQPVLGRLDSGRSGAPDDQLLRMLYRGTVAYYAGDFDGSGRSLQRAYDLAEDRYTKRASRGALSLVTNDGALPYLPGHNERLLVHYFAMQSYIGRGDVGGAAVEARRLSNLLERFDDARDPADASTRAVLRYLAGAVLEAAGEKADAEVAYRNARALAPGGSVPSQAEGVGASAGDVVVVIEQGFVAHRVEQRLVVSVASDEIAAFDGNDVSRKDGAASGLGARVLRELTAREQDAPYWDEGSVVRVHGSGDDDRARTLDHVLQVAWPVYRRSSDAGMRPGLVAASDRRAPLQLTADLSDAVLGDHRRDRSKILARAIARAATKYALTRLAEGRENGTGDTSAARGGGSRHRAWLGQVVNAAGVALERADLRSWHLLPGTISVARLTLPAGRHTIAVEFPAPGGMPPRRVVLDEEVEVRAGTVAFATRRIWRDGERVPDSVARAPQQ
jgi:hypothetical protein